MVDRILVADLYGTAVLELRGRADRVAATVHADALQRWGLGSRIVSVARPLIDRRFAPDEVVSRWFDNLLPEIGRPELAATYATTTRLFDLLAVIGRDSAGALVIRNIDEPHDAVIGSYRPVDLEGIAALVLDLARRPLGDDGRMRASLAGVQGKLMLAAGRDGDWQLPVDGAPSTHILKPEPLDVPFGSSANEAVCTRLARLCGLTPCESELLTLPGGRLAFVTSRYDRRYDAAGALERVHQEDMCQALDRAPGAKYEQPHESLLVRVAQMLSRYATVADVRRLLAQVTFHVAIGNADAHAKNVSILHPPDGSVQLAPVYDVANTVLEQARSAALAMSINGVTSIHDVTADDLVAEARRWKVREPDARDVIERTLASVREQLPRSAEGIWVPRDEDRLMSAIDDRTTRLLSGRSAGE